jgi:hypothetical protein
VPSYAGRTRPGRGHTGARFADWRPEPGPLLSPLAVEVLQSLHEEAPIWKLWRYQVETLDDAVNAYLQATRKDDESLYVLALEGARTASKPAAFMRQCIKNFWRDALRTRERKLEAEKRYELETRSPGCCDDPVLDELERREGLQDCPKLFQTVRDCFNLLEPSDQSALLPKLRPILAPAGRALRTDVAASEGEPSARGSPDPGSLRTRRCRAFTKLILLLRTAGWKDLPLTRRGTKPCKAKKTSASHAKTGTRPRSTPS